jgi:hypothetical protein
MEVIEAPEVGSRVRIRATGAIGVVVEVSRRHGTADVDLGDGIVAEMEWDEIEPSGPADVRAEDDER